VLTLPALYEGILAGTGRMVSCGMHTPFGLLLYGPQLEHCKVHDAAHKH